MTFYEDNPVELSCIDSSCDGVMEAEFPHTEGQSERSIDCPECGLKYTFVVNNWSDTPDDELSLNVYV